MGRVSSMKISPYGEVRVPAEKTIAYVSGDVPNLYLRDGSDARRLVAGHSIPTHRQYVTVINPYPRAVEVLIGFGLPIAHPVETGTYTFANNAAITSWRMEYRPAVVTGNNYILALSIKRGRAAVYFYERTVDYYTRIIMLPGCGAAPWLQPGFATDAAPAEFYGADGIEDKSIAAVSGTISETELNTYLANFPAVQGVRHANWSQATTMYTISSDSALLYVRDPDQAMQMQARAVHLGALVSEYE